MIGQVFMDQNRLCTRDRILADKFRVPKDINLYVIKDEAKKQWLMKHGAWIKQSYWDTEAKLRCLPPRSFPGAVEKGYISASWNAHTKADITSRFDTKILEEYKGGYQAKAIDAMAEYLKIGKGFFIRSGTATGKTLMICGIVDRLRHRALIVAPRKIINSQLYDDLSKYFDNVAIAEGKDIGKNLEQYVKADVLVVTHQTLNKHYDFLNGKYDIMILDEGHSCPVARLKQFSFRKGTDIIGLSANRKRGDVAPEDFPKLYGGWYDTKEEAADVKVILYKYKFTYPINDYLKAAQGYSPDSPEILRKLLINNDNRLETLLSLLQDIQKDFKRIIIFVDRVDYAEKIHKAIANSYIMTGAYDNNKTKNVLLALDNYVLVAMTQCVKEGMNIPNLEFGIMFHSTSELNTIQQVAGRVRRFAEDKQFGYLLDFVDIIKLDDGFGESKSKTLGLYNRKKIYEDLSFDVLEYDEFHKEQAPLLAL